MAVSRTTLKTRTSPKEEAIRKIGAPDRQAVRPGQDHPVRLLRSRRRRARQRRGPARRDARFRLDSPKGHRNWRRSARHSGAQGCDRHHAGRIRMAKGHDRDHRMARLARREGPVCPNPDNAIVVAREWIAKAENDLKNAAHTLKLGTDGPTDTVCFHAQQCVEKYLKAFLVTLEVAFPKRHDIETLVGLMPKHAKVSLTVEQQRRLTDYATVTR